MADVTPSADGPPDGPADRLTERTGNPLVPPREAVRAGIRR